MTMGVYIPSRGRAGVLFSKIMTIKFLDDSAVFVVPPDEKATYERALKNNGRANPVLACKEEGIAATRHWVGKQAKKRGEHQFVMMDDDLNFCVRKSKDGFHLQPADRDDVTVALAWLGEKMQGDIAHASISARQANNQMESGDVDTLVKYNKRTLRVLAYQTDPFLKMRHGRVPVMEDFDVNLQLLRAGYRNAVTFWWAQDQRETGSAGGCSVYRTHALHEAAALRLNELHPQFVTLRQKENKSGTSKAAAEFRTRTEVTIQWEKAYQSSQVK